MVTVGPTAEEAASVGRHFEHLSKLTTEGVCCLVGRTQNNDEKTIGLCVFRALNEAEARRIMQSDPAVVDGVMTAELFPFKIALWHNPSE